MVLYDIIIVLIFIIGNNLSLVLFLYKEKNYSIFRKNVVKSELPSRINGANKLQGGS